MSEPRHALYWVPPSDHPLWSAGCAWLEQGDHRAQPRRYGFHATLKPPFRLREGRLPDELLAAIHRLARAHSPFRMPALAVAELGAFLALRPRDPREVDAAHALRRLADACVRDLDEFRAPPGDEECRRRAAQPGLDELARRNVVRWGYPWVFEAWRFHMTLSDNLADDEAGRAARARLRSQAQAAFAAALAQPLMADGLALFIEDAPGAPLRLAQRFAFTP